MKIAALLPHVGIFGGVRRYLEIGNEFSRRGYRFVLFTPDGSTPEWLDFKGMTKSFSSLKDEMFDVGLCSEYSILPYFEQLNAGEKFFYFLLEGHKQEKEVAGKNYFFLGNSEGICRRLEKKYNISCLRAPGGVNPSFFNPLKKEKGKYEIRLICYGRIYKRRKGVHFVIRAAEGLYRTYPQLKLVFFDSLVGKDRTDPRPMINTHVPHDFYLNLPRARWPGFILREIFSSALRGGQDGRILRPRLWPAGFRLFVQGAGLRILLFTIKLLLLCLFPLPFC